MPAPPHRPYPYSLAQSGLILESLLASCALDEISTAEPGLGALARHLLHAGHVLPALHQRPREEQVLRGGVAFWLYPTGGKGPFEKLEDGRVRKHGLLLTVERGATVGDVLREVEGKLPERGIEHLHVPASVVPEDEDDE